MKRWLRDYEPSDRSGRSFIGSFFIKNGEPSNDEDYNKQDEIDLVDLEYIVVPETIDRASFEALFEYKGERYKLRQDWREHYYDKEIPVSQKSKKTLEGELVAQPTLCTEEKK